MKANTETAQYIVGVLINLPLVDIHNAVESRQKEMVRVKAYHEQLTKQLNQAQEHMDTLSLILNLCGTEIERRG